MKQYCGGASCIDNTPPTDVPPARAASEIIFVGLDCNGIFKGPRPSRARFRMPMDRPNHAKDIVYCGKSLVRHFSGHYRLSGNPRRKCKKPRTDFGPPVTTTQWHLRSLSEIPRNG